MADQYNARILKVNDTFKRPAPYYLLTELVVPEFLLEFHSATPRTDRMRDILRITHRLASRNIRLCLDAAASGQIHDNGTIAAFVRYTH